MTESELALAIDKINNLGRRLDFNISIQSLLVILGLFTILSPEKLKGFKLIFEYDIILASIIIPVLLMYLFIQFGYMLYNYHILRKLVDKQANIIYNKEDDKIQKLYNVFRGTRMVEMIYMKLKLDDIIELKMINDIEIPNFKFSIYPLWTYSIMVLLSLNHSIVFGFILSNWILLGITLSLILLIISIIILIGLYRDYILLSKNKNFNRLTIFNGIATIIMITVFLVLRYIGKI